MLSKIIIAVGILISAYALRPERNIDKELKPAHDRYMFFVENICKKGQYFYPLKVNVIYGDLQEDKKKHLRTVGECYYDPPIRFKIVIDREYYKDAPQLEQFQLMAHEMRHCLFGVDHSQDPNNYMYYKMPDITLDELERQIIADLETSCLKDK